MADQPTVSLNTGARMPQLGFGVFQVPPDEVEKAVVAALEAGYRSIDTAAMYRNEEGVGRAIAASGIDRADLFVTTKLDNGAHRAGRAEAAFDESLTRLGLDYVDLYLIHWPLPKTDRYLETWQALRPLYEDGRARALGVSNFQAEHLQRLLDHDGLVPAVNQIELHPYLTQETMRLTDGLHDVATEAWSPLGKGRDVLQEPTITGIAEKYGVSPAQSVIRWHLQLGNGHPEVGDSGTDRRELRRLRLRAGSRRRRRDQRVESGHPAGPGSGPVRGLSGIRTTAGTRSNFLSARVEIGGADPT